MKHVLALALVLCTSLACAGSEAGDEPSSDTTSGSEDELVATFDRDGQIDLTKRTHVLLVGDSDKLGANPLWAASSRARRYAQLYPGDQIVLFMTQDVKERDLAQTGATLLQEEPFGEVRLSDLRKLSDQNLVAALDRFSRIASLDFFGHSSPFGILLEAEQGAGRVVNATLPSNVAKLKDNFERAANPFVTLNGCNGAVTTAPQLSRVWGVPVSGSMTATHFQVLKDDGHFYRDDPASYPEGLSNASKNTVSYASAPRCSSGTCVRMHPDNYPYYGIWAPEHGMLYGLNYFKFFCDFADRATCVKGMAASLYAQVSDHPVDPSSSDEQMSEALADFFCMREKDPTWFEQCKAGLYNSVDLGLSFSPMKAQNDYTLECDMKRCEQRFRCDMVDGMPQKKTCSWVPANCPASTPAKECRTPNTKKRTTANEFAAYFEGHRLLRR